VCIIQKFDNGQPIYNPHKASNPEGNSENLKDQKTRLIRDFKVIFSINFESSEAKISTMLQNKK
jgi:hypothetical protein